MKMLSARITGTGMSVPESVVTNELLSRCMSTSDEWITQRTGIRERRMSPDTYRMLLRLAEAPDKPAFMRGIRDRGLDGQIDSSLTVTDLAIEASRMALKNAGIGPEDLDCIINATRCLTSPIRLRLRCALGHDDARPSSRAAPASSMAASVTI
jgi:3-oxoacyl-[acyl-carrier-protein] synthase-3